VADECEIEALELSEGAVMTADAEDRCALVYLVRKVEDKTNRGV